RMMWQGLFICTVLCSSALFPLLYPNNSNVIFIYKLWTITSPARRIRMAINKNRRGSSTRALPASVFMAAISAASIHGSASATACGEIGGVYTKTGAETCTIEPGSAFTAVIVENGGLLLPSGSVESTILNIAANAGASGTVTISGSGARWNADAVVLGDPDGSG